MSDPSNLKKIEISKLSVEDAPNLCNLLNSAPSGYSEHFIPFALDKSTIFNVLKNAKKYMYFGILVNTELLGFYMLRGFDNGYKIPSYGIYIAPEIKGMGIVTFTLYNAISICKINGLKKLMLKVNSENINARKIYEKTGFTQTGIDEVTGHLIYYKTI